MKYVFKFECPVDWEDLEKTDDEKIRYCGRCCNNVYFSETQAELAANAVKGNCVSLFEPDMIFRTTGIVVPMFATCANCEFEGQVFADNCPECMSPFQKCETCQSFMYRGECRSSYCQSANSDSLSSTKPWWKFW